MSVLNVFGKRLGGVALTATVVAVLTACGGGDIRTTAVKVVGDSLADSGTYGFKFTVQGNAADPTLIWADRVASAVAAPSLCARYTVITGGAIGPMQSLAACTSYGVGGARINPSGAALDLTPISIVQQLKELGAASPYGTDELLLADGGGNDVADLVTAYLGMTTDAGAAYTTLLAELLGWTRVSALAAGGGTALAAGGGEYMVALANSFADALTTQALDKGAQRVLVVNMPNVVRTPRFQHVLAGVAAASGGGATGAAASAQVAALVDGWVQAFNAQLKSRFATNGKVVVVDFHAELNKWLDTPSAYGLTNTTTPACPATGTDASGLPAYNIATCTATALSASQLTLGPDWWKTYVFSDNFHGTPRTNQLMGDLVVKALETKGWK